MLHKKPSTSNKYNGKACLKCNTTLRYIKRNQCVHCTSLRHKTKYKTVEKINIKKEKKENVKIVYPFHSNSFSELLEKIKEYKYFN
jgi:hypothetical protein